MGRAMSTAARVLPVGRKPNSSAARVSMTLEVMVVVMRLVRVRPTSSSTRGKGMSQLASRVPVSMSFLSEKHMPQKTDST